MTHTQPAIPDETHGGYRNRETWAVAMLINNDAGWQEETRTLALEAYASAYAPDGGPVVPLSSEDWQTYAVRVAGDALSEWADDLAEAVREGWASDAVRSFVLEVGSAWRVDWPHAARSVLPEHASYPHVPGYLFDCEACEASCHCTPGHTVCAFSGTHNGSGVEES